jgi:UDP:flavonoid glycosyltransferase YjiC (YdhE family)
MSGAEMVAERLRRWPDTQTQPATAWSGRMWTQIMAPTTLHDLLAITHDWHPDVIMHDEGDFAAPVAATSRGIPWITHGWGGQIRPSRELRALEDLTSDLWASCGLDVAPAAGLFMHALISPCPPFLERPTSGVTVWALRPRPLQGRGIATEADAYVGFGTVPLFANAPMELEAAVRTCLAHGLRVVVTAPDEHLRRRLAGLDERRVQAHEFVSLPDLLPSCRIVIAHAGVGTVLAALAHGVPLVVNDRGTPSQIRMADACQRAGVARRCDPAEIADGIDAVLADPSYAIAAKHAARQIAEMPEASELVPRIVALAVSRRE